MGVIQRQGIKHTIVQYAGIVIGVLSMLYVYPKVFEAYGLTQALIAAASFLASIVSLGSWSLAVKFFPVFKDKPTNHHGFFGVLLLICLFGFFLFSISFPFLRNLISEYFLLSEKTEWYSQFLPFILPFTFFVMINRLLTLYASNFQRIVVPAIFEEFLLKMTLPFLLFIYWLEIIPIEWVIYGLLINYSIATIGLFLYLGFLGQKFSIPDFGFLSKKLKKEMANYAGYGMITHIGAQSAFRIDTLMVAGNLDFASTGIYNQANFFSEAMSKPQKSILSISAPIISKAIQKNDLVEVKKIYKKSSLTLLIIGLFLFIGLWACLDDLFTIMDNPVVENARYPILFLCLARLFNMATSVNNEIINYSKYYRFNFWMIMVLAVLNILLNIWLIPIYQIMGAAIATFCSFILFNLAKVVFIKVKFGFHPFSIGTLIIIPLAILVYLITIPIPDLGSPYLNIILKASVITFLFPTLAYKLNISEDYNEMFKKGVKKFTPFLTKYFK